MMVGLQGSGKTHHHRQKTTTPDPARQAKVLMPRRHLIARPRGTAAESRPRSRDPDGCRSWPKETAQIARRALEAQSSAATTWCCSITAGPHHAREEMMSAAADIKTTANPHVMRAGRGDAGRPGRGSSRARPSTRASASPASCTRSTGRPRRRGTVDARVVKGKRSS